MLAELFEDKHTQHSTRSLHLTNADLGKNLMEISMINNGCVLQK